MAKAYIDKAFAGVENVRVITTGNHEIKDSKLVFGQLILDGSNVKPDKDGRVELTLLFTVEK